MTWLYVQIVTLHGSVFDENLLNNFSLHQDFVKETMRRNDFRFFHLSIKIFTL